MGSNPTPSAMSTSAGTDGAASGDTDGAAAGDAAGDAVPMALALDEARAAAVSASRIAATSSTAVMAEGVGFEPTEGCPSHAFQACRFGRSRTPPGVDSFPARRQ